MEDYKNFKYIYPPRPKNKVLPSSIEKWDNKEFICQPKINGSNAVIFLNEDIIKIYNRHNGLLTNVSKNIDFKKLYKGEGWMVLNGEYLNKNKNDENNVKFNEKLIIFDILVYNSVYLTGKTFEERINLLDEVYNKIDSDKNYLYKIDNELYRVRTYYDDFKKIYDDLTKIDLIEGLVLKKRNSKLELGIRESNNVSSQIKIRRSTISYSF